MDTVECPACEDTSDVPKEVLEVGGGWMDCSECGETIFIYPKRLPSEKNRDDITAEGKWDGEWMAVIPGRRRDD